MIDVGLAVSLVVAGGAVWGCARWWRRSHLLDALVSAVLVGAVVARVVHLAVEHPAGLLSPLELISLRSGAAWWPGVVAGVGWWWLRSGSAPAPARLVALAATVPLALVAHGTLAATCVVRDGCPGPSSAFGLVPPGLSSRVFPLGLAAGMVLVVLAVVLAHWAAPPLVPPLAVVGLAAGAVAVLRLVATLVTPTLGSRGPAIGVELVVVGVSIGVAVVGSRRGVASAA